MIKNIFHKLFIRYSSKTITKEKYIELAYKNHDLLFEYGEYLKNTDIKSILIQDSEVKMISRRNEITLLCRRDDKRMIPFEILNFKNYEGIYFDFFLTLVKESKVIFDIGANVGWHSLNSAKLDKKLKVFAFEPIKDTYKYLVKNIELNKLKNIIPTNIGLSDKDAVVQFYVNPKLFASASEKKITDLNTKRIKVTLTKMDDFYTDKNISRIDLIKCDVEGAELSVLKGAKESLEKFKPIIFIEMLRKWSKKYSYHPNDIIQYMKSLNYLCFDYEYGQLRSVNAVTDKTIATNYIFFHKIKHAKLIKKYGK